MAVLNDETRAAIWAEFQRANREQTGALTKADLRAAVNAIDDWIEANASAFNQAIPQPARSALSLKQKAMIFWYCTTRRWEVL